MRTKNFFAGVCASMMLAVSAIPAVLAADDFTVSISSATAKAGETVELTVDLANIPDGGINGCDFGIKYDADVIDVTSVTPGSLVKSETTNVEGMPDPFEYGIEDGLVSVIYGLGTTDSDVYMTGSGTFLTITAVVDADASAGTTDLEIVAIDRTTTPGGTTANSEIIFGNLGDDATDPVVYDPTFVKGVITIEDDEPTTGETTESTDTSIDIGEVTLLGDVNVDNIVDSADVTALNKYLLSTNGNPLKSSTAYANADTDGDGSITTVDSSNVLSHVLEIIDLNAK